MSAPITVTDLSKQFKRRHKQSPMTLKETLVRRKFKSSTSEEFQALDKVNFEIGSGEIVGIIGRNGAGKSTLLRMIGGVGLPDSGSITVRGKVGALLELGAGFHPELTGRENIYVNGVISGLTRVEVSQRFDDIVAFSELEDFIDNPLRTYSSGMQLRLAFAISVNTDPDILLIDEVLAVGDLAFQQKCLERIEYFKRKGCAILIVSHDVEQVKAVCDRVIWLRGGTIAAHGDPQGVAEQYEHAMIMETEKRRATESAQRIETGQRTQDENNRQGTREMEIIDVQIKNSDGMPIAEVERGCGLTVVISCKSREINPSVIFSLSISDMNGEIFLDTNTADLDMPAIDQKCVARVNIDKLDLPDGKYFLDLGIYEKDWVCIYDYHWHMHPLRVTEDERHGGRRKRPRWELLPTGQANTVDID